MLPQLSLSASLLYNNNSLASLLSNASKSWGLLGGFLRAIPGSLPDRLRAVD
jgi:outer membrane protein TolC